MREFFIEFLGRYKVEVCDERGTWRDGWANLYLGFNRFVRCKGGGGRVSSSSLSESMGSMVTIGEGFNLGKMEGMMI